MAMTEIYICSHCAGHHLEHGQDIHEIHYIRLFDKCHQKTEGAGYKEQKYSVEIHTRGILHIKEEVSFALENILEIKKQRYYLLMHIAPRQSLISEGIHPTHRIYDKQNNRHRQRRNHKRYNCKRIFKKTFFHNVFIFFILCENIPLSAVNGK